MLTPQFGSMAMRTIFLMAIFPRLIACGRARLAPNLDDVKDSEHGLTGSLSQQASGSFRLPSAAEDTSTPPPTNATFDIHFLRLSILVDALITGSVSLVRRDWQLFVAAAILPLASGTGPAAKGVVTELVGPEHRQEALSAIALVESFASVSTVGIFGTAYAALAKAGMPQMVFVANAVRPC